MVYQFTPYAILLLISATILLGLLFYAYRFRTIRGAKIFIVAMLLGVFWCLGNIFEMAAITLDTKLFWANFQYLAYGFAPISWLVLVFRFTGRANWINKKNLILMSIIPVITILLVWTNQYHHLMRYNVRLVNIGVFSVISKNYGLWFWVHFLQAYSFNFFSIILLLRTVWKKNTIYQKQAMSLLIGLGLIMIFNILYVTGLSPFQGQDITPLIFGISGLIIAWGIFRFRLFDLVPIARTTVMEKMATGVIVIDKLNRIIDINPRAKNIFSAETLKLGENLANISDSFAVFLNRKKTKELYQEEIMLIKNGSKNYYEIYISPLRDYRQDIIAHVIIINDITDMKSAREEINKQQEELAVMSERERMARDLHDNLGQILSFANVQTQAISKVLTNGEIEQADDYLKRLSEIIRDAHQEIREYVYQARDNTYYKVKLTDIIYKQIKSFKETTAIRVELSIDENIKLNTFSSEEKKQLDNILKEALTNILKHASASQVEIKFSFDQSNYHLEIKDNGTGIQSQDLAVGKTGSGFSIMNERTKIINGKMKVESRSGSGTKLSFQIPVKGRGFK